MVLFRKFIFLISILLPISSFAEIVNEIDISGLDSVSRGTVLNYIPLEIGDDFSNKNLNTIVTSLSRTDLFSSVKVNFNNGILKIQIVENPTIKYFDFKNYEDDLVLNNEIIESMISNFNLNVGKVFVQSNLDKLIQSLKKTYQTQAFYNTQVSLKTNLDEKNRVGIELVFDEGERALINSIKIFGNQYFSEDDLLDEFDIGTPDFFIINYFTERDHFSTKAYEAGIESLKSKYLEAGFLGIAVTDSKIHHISENNSLNIEITINEGEQFHLGNIDFDADILLNNQDQLRSFFDIEKGDKFERRKIVSGINKISNQYQNKGYAYVKIDSKLLPTDSKDVIDIMVSIKTDDVVFIDRIDIAGNNITQDDVIRRKLSILEGQRYSKLEINESINRIKRLGYFSSVEYDLKRHSENPDRVDIFIEVTETKTGEFTIGLSHSNATGAALTAGISQQNILGTGNILKASFSNSDAVQNTALYFKDPYFNNLGHSISYGFFKKSLDATNIQTSDYLLDESGVNFGYGVPLQKDSDIFGEFRVSSIDLKCGTALLIDEPKQCSKNDDLNFNFSITYSSDTLNDFYFPSDGSKNTLRTVLSMPGSDLQYFKTEVSHKSYEPVFKDKIFKLSSRLNLASGIGDDDLPFFERYFEGGSSSVRGFDFNSLGSKYVNSGKPKGGELSFISSAALGSSLKFAGIDNDNMRISIFVDAGTIAEKTSNFSLNDARSSVGMQFTWLTPVGPIGLHYAKPIIKKSTDVVDTFRFDLGASF